jgi:predicted GNAT family acetyltransferase
MKVDVRDVPSGDRHEGTLDGEVIGWVTYRRADDGVVHLTHAEVLPHVGGRGVGTSLVQAALDDLAERGERIVPICGFVRNVVRDNPRYHELLAS